MVDRYPSNTPEEGSELFFYKLLGAEGERRFIRIEQLARARAILDLSLELDRTLAERSKLASLELSKKFVSLTSGNNNTYPFLHYRIKMKPKNRIESPVKVAALRFPIETDGDDAGTYSAERLYIAWEMLDGTEHTYALDNDEFSSIVLNGAFNVDESGTGTLRTEARSSTDANEESLLQSVLYSFEPDLQTTDPELSA